MIDEVSFETTHNRNDTSPSACIAGMSFGITSINGKSDSKPERAFDYQHSIGKKAIVDRYKQHQHKLSSLQSNIITKRVTNQSSAQKDLKISSENDKCGLRMQIMDQAV